MESKILESSAVNDDRNEKGPLEIIELTPDQFACVSGGLRCGGLLHIEM